jgi:hypothetical protein
MRPLRTIPHPTEFSAPSEEALCLACGLTLADPGTRLIVLHFREAVHVVSKNLETVFDERLRMPHPPGPGVYMEYRSEEGDLPGPKSVLVL